MKVLQSYLKHYLKSKRRHGVHSPFVYELMDKCLSQKIKISDKEILLRYSNHLKNCSEVIVVKDFGAGSKKMGNERPIKSIYKYSSTQQKYGEFLYKISSYYRPKNMLELGTSLGYGSLYLHLGNRNACIDTIEGCPNTYKFTKDELNPFVNNQVNFHRSTFDSFLKNTNTIYDLIFIDGNHQKNALFAQLEWLDKLYHDETFIIIDDIRWSLDMLEAWEELIHDERFNVSLDFGRMGIILPRKKQERESFHLKI